MKVRESNRRVTMLEEIKVKVLSELDVA